MSPLTTQSELPENTRDRLLIAAREVFGELGFKGATVREICRRAGVNVAAVNYHFNGKEALFMAALELEPITDLIAPDESGSAEERLTRFIREFVGRVMEQGCTPHTRLLLRELHEPSPALDSIAKTFIVPLHQHLTRLVRGVVGDEAPAAEVRRCVFSIFGQCTYYRNSREMNHLVYPELHYDEQEIEAAARHIAEFSLAGIKRVTSD